jgi:putative PIN family toxin of toxin-antitoxin system
MRIVCDTNVLVSALIFGGNPRTVLELVSARQVEGFSSAALLREFEEVLLRPKFELSPEQVAAMVELVRDTFRSVAPSTGIRAVPADPDDDAVVATALAAGADLIVSGDGHLLDLGQFGGVRILSSAQLVAEFGGRAGAAQAGEV